MRLSNDTFCAASIARSLVSRNISCRYWDASLRFGFEVSRWLAVVMSGAVAFQITRVNKFDLLFEADSLARNEWRDRKRPEKTKE